MCQKNLLAGISGVLHRRNGKRTCKYGRKYWPRIGHFRWHPAIVASRAALVIVLIGHRGAPAVLVARCEMRVRHRKRLRTTKHSSAQGANQDAGEYFLFHLRLNNVMQQNTPKTRREYSFVIPERENHSLADNFSSRGICICHRLSPSNENAVLQGRRLFFTRVFS